MILQSLSLQHFRNYSKANFTFDPRLTIIVGPNAVGKTNLVEAISILATGKSFRTSKEKQLIHFSESVAHVSGSLRDDTDEEKIEITFAENASGFLQRRYLINGVSKRRTALNGLLPIVLFTPIDLAIVSGQPGARRRFLDEVLEQTDKEYADALMVYMKALRQRNALLDAVQATGRRDDDRFAYWDGILIANGQRITAMRESLIAQINTLPKPLFQFTLEYDKSVISHERLEQYKTSEAGAGVTLVGPQRDDVFIKTLHPVSREMEDVKSFCSRGQQRLVTLGLKDAQIYILKERLEQEPLLVLDDIFSELDSSHIALVLEKAQHFQTIITTTHREFIDTNIGKAGIVIELGR